MNIGFITILYTLYTNVGASLPFKALCDGWKRSCRRRDTICNCRMEASLLKLHIAWGLKS